MRAVTRKQIELAKHDSRWIRAEDAEHIINDQALTITKIEQEINELRADIDKCRVLCITRKWDEIEEILDKH